MNILDRPTFPANDPDARELMNALFKLYYEKGPVQALAKDVGLELAAITWDGAMIDAWPSVLEQAAAARPSKLRALVQLIADGADDAWAPLFRRILSAPGDPGPADPCLAHVLAAHRPFIDRRRLRENLRELMRPDGSRVLVITGPKDSGKSHSWFLINHVGDRAGPVPCRRVDLAAWTGAPAGALLVATSVAQQFGWEEPRADPTNAEDNAVFTLTNWFKGKAAELAGPWWLVFDGLNASSLGEGALRMVASIAAAAAGEEAGELRVVLIAFEQHLSAETEPSTLREALQPVPSKEVESFFRSVAGEAGAQLDEGAMKDIILRVLGPPPHPASLALREVGPRAGKVVRSLLGAYGG